MIKQLKKQAQEILRKHYKQFVLPVILCVFASFGIGASAYLFRDSINVHAQSIFFVLFFGFNLCVAPVTSFFLIKTSTRLIYREAGNDQTAGAPFALQDAARIIVIMLVPNVLGVLGSYLDIVMGYLHIPYSSSLLGSLMPLVSLAVLCYIDYKMFACDYYYAVAGKSVKETIAFSFDIMHDRFLEIILLGLSFILWYVLSAVLLLLLSAVLPIYGFVKILLQACGCGVYAYLLPYQHITYTLYVKKLCEMKEG